MTLRIVVADDHPVVLQGLQAFLSLEEDIELLELCRDGAEAVKAVETHTPDLLVLDSAMPQLSGLEVYSKLRERRSAVPTVLLAASIDDDTLLALIEASIEGIVLKEAASSDLVRALRAVAAGERWIAPALSARVLQLVSRRQPSDGDCDLTPREREIATLAAAGESNKRIAAQLRIATSTVKMHLNSAFRKLDVQNRVQLGIEARARGCI